MASQIKLKKSSEPGKVPQTLEYGELALNYADGILYYKTSTNQISQLVNAGSTPQVDWANVLNKPSFAQVSTSGSYTDLINTPTLVKAAVQWTPYHTLADGTRYLAGDVVYDGGNIFVALYDNESIPTTSTTYWQNLGAGNRLNIDGRDIPNIQWSQIENAPTIPTSLLGLGITDGTSGQILSTNGNGTFSFITPSGGSGGTGTSLTDNNFLFESGSEIITATIGTVTNIDEFSADLWRSCRYQVQITTEYTYYTCDITVIHSNTGVTIAKSTEVNTTENNPGEFSAQYVTGTPNLVRLKFTPEHNQTQLVFTRTLLANTGSALGVVAGDLETQSGIEDLGSPPSVTFDLN